VKTRFGLPHAFVIAGDRGFDKECDNSEIDRTIAELRMENDVLSVGHVPGICTDGDPSHRKLPFLMAGADVYMFCSLYEGFGLPVLESMACGTPVLTSTIPVMKEVVGEAGVFADPFDVEQIAGGLARLLQEPEFRADLVRKGWERIKQFSWRKNAEQSLAYYEEVYQGVKGRT
jgi:glycosyltransferase involved in cell wall biosynthesis